jgi:hypothetical protein
VFVYVDRQPLLAGWQHVALSLHRPLYYQVLMLVLKVRVCTHILFPNPRCFSIQAKASKPWLIAGCQYLGLDLGLGHQGSRGCHCQ